MFRTLFISVFFIAVVLLAGSALARYLDAPYYFKSYSTKQCIYIENADGSRVSCDAYDPDLLYIQKWVK